MGKKPLKLGDLVDLKGLEKPGENVVKVELGGKEIDRLGEHMSGFAGHLESNKNVRVGTVVGLVTAIRDALKHELLPEIAEKLLETLRERFENPENMNRRHPGLEWAKVKAKLEANPDKLWSLHEMEKTEGYPDVVEFDEKTGEFIFMDCSVESPEGRRNCVYDVEGEEIFKRGFPSEKCNSNAVSLADLMGVDILNEEQYRFLQTKGEFDRRTWSWIKPPVETRRAGVALRGDRDDNGVSVSGNFPYLRNGARGWRAVLWVK